MKSWRALEGSSLQRVQALLVSDGVSTVWLERRCVQATSRRDSDTKEESEVMSSSTLTLVSICMDRLHYTSLFDHFKSVLQLDHFYRLVKRRRGIIHFHFVPTVMTVPNNFSRRYSPKLRVIPIQEGLPLTSKPPRSPRSSYPFLPHLYEAIFFASPPKPSSMVASALPAHTEIHIASHLPAPSRSNSSLW